MSLGPSLIVPVTLWGRHPPTHRISSLYLTPDQRTLVTGCTDGQIVTWTVQPGTLEINPYMMLVGHTARVVCLSDGLLHTNHKYLVSSAVNGEMCVWDLQEGQCIETVKMSFIHRQISAYQPAHASDVLLYCCGEYADIAVVHPLTLEVVYWLSSKVNSNWVTSLHIFRPRAVTDDIVMAINTDSVVKIWTLPGFDEVQSPADIIYENESKRIRCSSVHFLKCCSFNPRTVLVVSSALWQIYDASDFSLLCTSSEEDCESWTRGEFLAADRVIVWADSGHAYIYKLPPNCIPSHDQFHSREADEPFLYCVLSSPDRQELFCPPVSIHTELVGEPGQQVLVRGDCLGQVALWRLPQLTNTHIQQLMEQEGEYQSPAELPPTVLWSIERAWRTMKPQPVGILDQLESAEGGAPRLTSSIYLPLQEGRLVCGREDGTIIIVSATHTVMLHLLHGKHQSYDNWPVHQILSGHRGPVTALLFPHLSHSRYQISHLVSGGEDFSVCLWDLINGALLHRFVVQAGIVLQLHVPPESVSSRMQQCICSVAADYSVALLSLKERKCLMLASRHLFPVTTVKWRPLDDFLVVATEDGSVSVWQMETGHLDRVVHGTTAQEVLSACDEHMTVSTSEGGMANPAVHFFRGLRHRNLSAIRHAAKRGLQQLQNSLGNQGQNGPDKPRAYSLMVQGLRTSPSDPDAHVLFFDIESLIVDLLTEAYSQMTTEQLEEHGLIQLSEYQRVLQLTQSESPDAQQKITEFFGRVKNKAGDMEKRLKDKDTRGYLSRMKELKEQSEAIRDQLKERAEGSEDLRKLKSRAQVARNKLEEKIKHEMEDNPDAAGILARVKEGAETMGGIIHAKAGGVTPKGAGEEHKDSDGELEGRSRIHLGQTENQTMEICQLLLSLIHAWGVDAEIDRLCESKLGMLRPKHPVCYGLISKHGFVSLLLPTFLGGPASAAMSAPLAERTVTFTRRTHWELSCALTSNHLLAVIALADTLMSMNNTSFMSETERRKRLQKQLTRSLSQSNQTPNKSQEGLVELQANFWAQVREGWSKMATLHCVQFPERLDASGVVLKKPLVEMLARRWQDRCIEIRQAAQALLLAELRRLSPRSLKALVDWWAPMLPSYGEASSAAPAPASSAPLNDDHDHTDGETDDYGAEDQMEEEAARRAAANAAEVRRKQATAIILLGVIGAEFGQAVSGGGGRAHGVEGFGLGPLALRTSQALAHLLLAPPTAKLPAHTPLRRAAIDLIGRGFAQWEPHIDASRVLLAMLELCCEADGMAPSMTYGLPLAAAADTARTARHAVALIATARPQVFVTTMAREVARYNSLQQNAQSINVVVHHSVLMRAKPEILRVISLLIEKSHNELVKFLIELTDILLHCLDPGHLRQRPLQEVFPVVGRFHQITHCTSSRRVAVGTANGTLAIYDLRQTNKTQQLHAHTKAITACSFSPDGKFLASYSTGENKISFWQTSAGMFGLGHSQTRCVKTYSTPPLPEIVRMNPPRQSRLVWVANKTVTLLLSDGTEQRYNV